MTFSRNRKSNKNSGFTLVEMIVVLVILGILASVAVYSIIGYINMTRYKNNQQNAISIFQSAQSALNHMSEAGTQEEWVKSILGSKAIDGTGSAGLGTADEYDASNSVPGGAIDNIFNQTFFEAFPYHVSEVQPGQSAHMRYAVTYTPYPAVPSGASLLTENQRNQNKVITDLIGPDFNSTELFEGIITIEFDIEKVIDTNGTLRFSANVYAVFYDSKRTVWDGVALNGHSVPCRDEEYRRNDSFVGYASGANGASTVDTVYLPADTEIKDTIFTLRNGETLELTWSAKTDSTPVTGMPAHIHYTFSLYDADGEAGSNKFCDLVVNEGAILGGNPRTETQINNSIDSHYTYYEQLKFDKATFTEGQVVIKEIKDDNGPHDYSIVYTSEKVSNEKGIPITIYRASIHTTAKVYVHKGSDAFDYNNEFNNLTTDSRYYNFPITISYEIYDVSGTSISERISYSLSLDAMMTRNLIKNAMSNNNLDTARVLDYSINRLINNSNKLLTDKFPRNFYATMKVENDNFGDSHTEYNGNSLASTDLIYAERALNDPLYLQNDGSDGNEVYYRYFANAAFREAGKEYAIVNSYFGDLEFGSFGTKPNVTPGSSEEVAITSFRHLYNIRMLEGNSTHVNYTICRNLNWYTTYTKNDSTKYRSEVILYSPVNGGSGLKGFSPVQVPNNSSDYYGDKLSVVAFPSLPSLRSGSTLIGGENSLSALPDGEDKTSVINNLQMRMSSFYSGSIDGEGGIETKLSGYGFICTNSGTIINIRANGWIIILNDTPNGASNEGEEIADSITSFISGTVKTKEPGEDDGFLRSSPLGGLVGANNGTIGSDKETDANKNTIRFSNCIVSSMFKNGNDWELYRVSACGGIIGDNNKNLYGHIEACGHFASVGWRDVSAAIGYSQTNIDALILVDNEKYKENAVVEFTDASSVILGTSDSVGGALGYLKDNLALCQNPEGIIHTGPVAAINLVSASVGTSGNEEGNLSIVEASDVFYAIKVNLDEKSYIMMRTNDPLAEDRPVGIGGAVGRITNYKGELLSIHVENKGIIASTEGDRYANGNYVERHLGGAIGILNGCTASNIYISVINHSNIGTLDRTSENASPTGYCRSTGGAIGRISNIKNPDGKVTISVINHKGIYGNTSQNVNHSGVGGAVGSVIGDNTSDMPKFFFLVENEGQILNSSSDTNSTIGTGGSIGVIKYLPRGSAIYCLMDDSASIKTSGNNAGGIIGAQTNGVSSCNATAPITLTVKLNGTSITAAGNNAGGAIGYSGKFDSYTTIRTRIAGTISINAYSNAGGISGRMYSGATTGSALIMQSTQTSSILNIKSITSGASAPALGNDNAGGIIGYLTGQNAFTAGISLPGVSGSNQAYINVDCYDNAGGVIGQMEFQNHDFGSESSALNVSLLPGTHINARRSNAGGVFGLLNAKKYFNTGITLTTVASISNYPEVKAGTSFAGGIIGRSIGGMTQVADFKLSSNGITVESGRYDENNNYIKGDYVGGCIGGFEGGANINGNISITGSNIELKGSDYMGGVIGNGAGSTINGGILSECPNLTIDGGTHVGGCIGRINNVKLSTTGSIIYNGSNLMLSGTTNVGGCIGFATGTDGISGKIYYSGPKAHILASSDCTGGLIGAVSNCKFSNAELIFSVEHANIKGKDYLGGIIGGYNQGSINDHTILTFNGNSPTISGKNNVGGIIGYFTGASINGTAELNYKSVSAVYSESEEVLPCEISGSGNNVGGIIGWFTGGSINGASVLSNESVGIDNYPSTIKGEGDNVGGIIGCFSGSNINGTTVLKYQSTGTESSPSSIKGIGDNVGGIFGKIDNGSSSENSKYTYTGKYTSIKGNNNVGGIMGVTDTFKNSAAITFKPDTRCVIDGKNSIGGIAGLGISQKDKGNLHNHPDIILDGCTLDITGTGYVGGALGWAQKDCWYSGTVITVTNYSTLFIQSTQSIAGGTLGYLTDGRAGDGTYLTTSCTNHSSIQINGHTVSGGLIGKIAKAGKKASQPHISITVDEYSTFNVSADDNNAYAGGLIGVVMEDGLTRNNEIMNLPAGGGAIHVSCTQSTGHWGALIGYNKGTYTCNAGYPHNVRIYASDFPSDKTAMEIMFGETTTTVNATNFTYTITALNDDNSQAYTRP